MGRLRDELRVIPAAGIAVAVSLWLLMTVGMALLFAFAASPGDPPLPLRALMMIVVPVPMTIWALAVAYINGDAARRGMNRVLWTLLAIFVPSGIGLILYFLMRDPLLAECPGCHQQVRAGLTFCPYCGHQTGTICAQCRRAVEPAWRVCAYCGTTLAAPGV